MKIIGITGGVGSGKSRILSYMKEQYHAYICQADHVAWQLQMPGEGCYEQIVRKFGEEILNEDGTISRKNLGQIVFASHEQLTVLNQIMHPAVKEHICSLVDEKKMMGVQIFVLEAALLLEEHYDEICDEVWYIYTSESARRERLKSSRQYTDEKIDQMTASQLPEHVFRENCDRIIDNNASFEETERQIKEIMG